jgi:hypothetical protein
MEGGMRFNKKIKIYGRGFVATGKYCGIIIIS